IIEPKLARPVLQICRIISRSEQIAHIAQLDFGMRVLRPSKFRDDQILFSCNEGVEFANGNSLTPVKLHPPILRSLADNAGHFDYAFLMNEIENRFTSDEFANIFLAHVIVRPK